MQLLGGEEPHQVLRLEPDALVSDRSPEEDERLAIDPPTFTG